MPSPRPFGAARPYFSSTRAKRAPADHPRLSHPSLASIGNLEYHARVVKSRAIGDCAAEIGRAIVSSNGAHSEPVIASAMERAILPHPDPSQSPWRTLSPTCWPERRAAFLPDGSPGSRLGVRLNGRRALRSHVAKSRHSAEKVLLGV